MVTLPCKVANGTGNRFKYANTLPQVLFPYAAVSSASLDLRHRASEEPCQMPGPWDAPAHSFREQAEAPSEERTVSSLPPISSEAPGWKLLRQLRWYLRTEFDLVPSLGWHSRAIGISFGKSYTSICHLPDLPCCLAQEQEPTQSSSRSNRERAYCRRLAELSEVHTCSRTVRQKLSDKVLTQENSLIQLISVLILLCQVAKAEENQFNSSGHTGTPQFLFRIPPPSPVLFITWSGAGLSHRN